MVVFGYFLLGLINDVLEMGERLQRVHPWLTWSWYALIVLILLAVAAVPARWLIKAPVRDYRILFEEEIPEESHLREMVRSLDPNGENPLLQEKKEGESLRAALLETLKEREKETDDFIVQASMLTFLTTAISPNGFIDILAVIYYNFRMVGTLVDRFGIRPSFFHLLTILRNVFLTAFVVNQLEELELNEYVEELMESFGEIATGKLLSKTVDSLMQGILAAFVTLKIGYATKALLINPENTKKYGFRRSIRRSARQSLVREVLPKSAASLPRGFGRMVVMVINKMKSSQPEMS